MTQLGWLYFLCDDKYHYSFSANQTGDVISARGHSLLDPQFTLLILESANRNYVSLLCYVLMYQAKVDVFLKNSLWILLGKIASLVYPAALV